MNITSAWCNYVKVETAKQVTILKGIWRVCIHDRKQRYVIIH